MQLPFVKKFDFRGIYNHDITDSDSFYLGHAIWKTFSPKKVLIGWDTRVSSRNLALAFIQALKTYPIEISYSEKCPIDYITAGSAALDFNFSVMFTGSHNPWDWTGLLMHTKNGDSVQGDEVAQIISHYYEVNTQDYTKEDFPLSQFHDFTQSIERMYGEKIQSLIPLEHIKPLSILVDIGDGSGDKSLSLLEKLVPQLTITRINNRGVYDQNSSHTADPSNEENMHDLIRGLSQGMYHVGFAFDSDADRVLAVDEKGAYLNGSLLGSAIVEGMQKLQFSDKAVGYAVDCGISLYNTVEELKKQQRELTIQPVPVGRSLLRKKLRDGSIDFAVENVGHFYCKDFFMTDSAVFSLVMILYWMSIYGPLSHLSLRHPDGFREQLMLPLSAAQQTFTATLTAHITTYFHEQEVRPVIVDGIRLEIVKEGKLESWIAMRQSGYERIEKYFYGSLNENDFQLIKNQVHQFLPKEVPQI